jgi:hypothetical protein
MVMHIMTEWTRHGEMLISAGTSLGSTDTGKRPDTASFFWARLLARKTFFPAGFRQIAMGRGNDRFRPVE